MAAGSGFQRIVQQDLSGGMFPALAPELIPANGAFDITNGLLNEQNVVARRGGSNYFSSAPAGSGVRVLWTGYLKHGGLQTILCSASGSWRIEPSGELHAIPLIPPNHLSGVTVFQGVLYFQAGRSWDGETAGIVVGGSPPCFATAGNRLLYGQGSRVTVSTVPEKEGDSFSFPETNYFSLPEGVEITGMFGWRTSCVVFTTRGIWLLSGLENNITDEAGNVQWQQDLYSPDTVLWGEAGIAGWKGGLVIPAKDDVWLMELGVSSEKSAPFRALSGPIRNVYRGYVAAGYTPGQAVVFNGHYFLPILNGESVIDLLVCRLEGVNDAGKAEPAWSRLKGFGAELAALATTVSDLEGPLIGVTVGVARVLKLGYFEPGATFEKDANGSNVSFEITTRSIPTGQLTPNLVAKLRLGYRMVAPQHTKLLLAFGETPYGPEWGSFDWAEADWTSATGPFSDLGDSIPVAEADPEALFPKTWRVGRKVRYVRLKITLDGPASQVSLRALELAVRLDGRVF